MLLLVLLFVFVGNVDGMFGSLLLIFGILFIMMELLLFIFWFCNFFLVVYWVNYVYCSSMFMGLELVLVGFDIFGGLLGFLSLSFS